MYEALSGTSVLGLKAGREHSTTRRLHSNGVMYEAELCVCVCVRARAHVSRFLFMSPACVRACVLVPRFLYMSLSLFIFSLYMCTCIYTPLALSLFLSLPPPQSRAYICTWKHLASVSRVSPHLSLSVCNQCRVSPYLSLSLSMSLSLSIYLSVETRLIDERVEGVTELMILFTEIYKYILKQNWGGHECAVSCYFIFFVMYICSWIKKEKDFFLQINIIFYPPFFSHKPKQNLGGHEWAVSCLSS